MSQTTSKAKLPKPKASHSLFGSAELIRQLQPLLEKELPQSQTRFSERLTQNMDFTSSLKLSEVHGQLRMLERKGLAQTSDKSSEDQKKALNAAFERVYRSILQNIDQSFDQTVTQPRFPLPQIDLEALDLSAYQNFYQAQQVEMSAKIQGLRAYVRDTLSLSSVNMAKLALLDNTLEETIGFPLRSGFASVSKVIVKYSEKLAVQLIEASTREHTATVSIPSQLARFHEELHQLLAAELELRLQPIQGLINAFNQEVL